MEKTYVYLDKNGVYRPVGHPRMMLELIVGAFHEGDSPESIRSQWPFLSLEEVYGCITYYLANKQVVDEYMKIQEQLWLKAKAEYDAQPNPLRDKLLKIKEERAKANT